MLSRTVMPLSRPNVLASVVRTSTLSAWPSLYTAHKLSPGVQQRAKSNEANKSKSMAPKASSESIPEQPKADAKAAPNATEPSGTPEPGQTPQKPLPDLTQGIPSTLAAELEGRMKKGSLNLTEDPTRSEQYSEEGQGGGDIPKGGYETSLDRRKARITKLVYAGMLLASVVGIGYSGRNWDTEEESQAHPETPSGWGIGLWYSRIKARMGDLTSYYKDPAFPKLLPDEDAEMTPPYTLVLSLEDLLVHSEWSREHGWRLAKRPGVDYFLRYLNQYYELVLFTSVPSMMADQVLRKLDPYRIIRWPLFREATRYKDGEYIKDLAYLNRDMSKIILIDTKEEHARHQPENAIILDKWTGDPKDKTLVALIPFLEYLAGMGVEDVRTVLKTFEDGQSIPMEFAKREKEIREHFEKQLAEEKKKNPSRGIGSLASALGLKPSTTLNSQQTHSEGSAQNKMIWDEIRERGQKNYEMVESEIRLNGDKWLAEIVAEEEKAHREQMQSMQGFFTGMFGFGGSKEQ